MMTMAISKTQPLAMEPVNNNDVDDLELEAQGYTREMPRQFNTVSLMSMSYALLATWNGFGSAFGTGFTEASSAGSIWTLFIAGLMTLVIAIGMGELSSAYPVAGSQFHWTFMISSPEWAPFASYFAASISTFGWWLGLASVTNFIAAMILGCAALCWENYVIERWHVYLVFVFITWAAIGLNIFGSRLLPAWNSFMMYFSLVLLVATITTLLACASPNYQSARFVFTDTTNSTGWRSDGFAFILCMLNALYGYLGVDCGAHLSEEIPNPTVNVPKVIIYPVIIGFVTTLPFAISLSFIITDLEAVIASRTGLPLIEAYYQATESKAGTVVLIAGFALCLFGAACANVTSSSRQMWSAARNNCFPYSHLWKQVHPRFNMPMNASCASGIFVTLYGLIFLGSSAAFSSMVGACIVFMTSSYVIPQGILAWRGRDEILPTRHMNLGRFGLPINVLACVWVVLVDILYCFPTTYPVTTENMNWIRHVPNFVVVVCLVAFVLVSWFTSQRHVFKGPEIKLDVLRQTRGQRSHRVTIIHGTALAELEQSTEGLSQEMNYTTDPKITKTE